MWPAPRQQVPRPASFYLKRMQLFISASLTSLGEVAAVHILSLEDVVCVCVLTSLCVFVCVRVAVLDVHHLSFPDKTQHLRQENGGYFCIEHNSLYTVSPYLPLSSHRLDLPFVLCPQGCTTSTQRGTGCVATCSPWAQAPCTPMV